MEQNIYGEWLEIECRRNFLIHDTNDGTKCFQTKTIGERPSKPQGLTCIQKPKCRTNKALNPAMQCYEEEDGVSTSSQIKSSLNFRKGHKTSLAETKDNMHRKDFRNIVLEGPDTSQSDWLDNGYDVFEYVVRRVDQRMLTVLKLPMLVVALIVILWSFSAISSCYTVCLVLILGLLAYLQAWNTIVQETLTVTSTLGIQVQQTNVLGKRKYAKYVPIENIKAVVINEIIRRQRVISYLLIVLEAAESTGKVMVPLLTGTLPRLRTIENIYQNVQKVIF